MNIYLIYFKFANVKSINMKYIVLRGEGCIKVCIFSHAKEYDQDTKKSLKRLRFYKDETN